MNEYKLGAMAYSAMTCMLSTTIKPGLIDRRNRSPRKPAASDIPAETERSLDFFTALDGFGALSPWFTEIASQSVNSASQSPTSLFSNIRALGVKAEKDMLRATGGINTHKGAFFFVALCVAAAGRIISGRLNPDSSSVSVVAAEMTQGICRRELDTLDVKIKVIGGDSLTTGESMYIKYEAPGARGEAQNGFPTVIKYALPVMRKLMGRVNTNDVYVQTYMTLLANVMDTNILAKENDLAAEEVQDRAKGILERGGVLTPLGREKIEKLDSHLRERGLTPGGSAAMLAAAIFLYHLDEESKRKSFKL